MKTELCMVHSCKLCPRDFCPDGMECKVCGFPQTEEEYAKHDGICVSCFSLLKSGK